MFKRKFLKEINEMTRKGIYPSLSILLEEEAAGDDRFNFPDDNSKPKDTPESDDDTPESDDDTPESDDSANNAMVLDQFRNSINQYLNADEARKTPSPTEINLFGEDLSLLDFTLVNEDFSTEDMIKKVSDVVKKKEKEIEKFDVVVADKVNGVDINIQELISDAMHDTEFFLKKENPADIIAKRYVEKIRGIANLKEIEKLQQEFIDQFKTRLDKNTIPHTLSDIYSVNSEDNNDYNDSVGATKQS